MDTTPAPTGEKLAHLEQENQALRDKLNQATANTARGAQGCFTVVGILVIGLSVSALVFFALYQYPPWIKVRSQYHQVLYWSKWVKDYEAEFAGFDHIGSPAKRVVNKPGVVASEQLFDVTEYRVYWPVLWLEWLVVCGFMGLGYYRIAHKRHSATG